VLVFALASGLLPWGLLAVYAMGVGVGLTVAAIAAVAVLAGGASGRLAAASGSRTALFAMRALEGAAAVAVLALGMLLLAAALAR
jgi:ABC-type nickel/cobalt efflux system permease component RcnA